MKGSCDPRKFAEEFLGYIFIRGRRFGYGIECSRKIEFAMAMNTSAVPARPRHLPDSLWEIAFFAGSVGCILIRLGFAKVLNPIVLFVQISVVYLLFRPHSGGNKPSDPMRQMACLAIATLYRSIRTGAPVCTLPDHHGIGVFCPEEYPGRWIISNALGYRAIDGVVDQWHLSPLNGSCADGVGCAGPVEPDDVTMRPSATSADPNRYVFTTGPEGQSRAVRWGKK